MYCTECGIIIPDGAKFCSSCGNRISTSEETTTPEQEDIQVEVRELREVIATARESNTRAIVLIGMAFFCLFLIFKPGPLGFSMYDLTSVDCDIDFDDGVWYENADCVAERNTEQFQVAILGIISLACFVAVLKKPESEEEQEHGGPEKEAVVSSPLEENIESLKRKKLVEKWSGAVVLIICIYCISLIITPTDTGLLEKEDRGYQQGRDVLMMNAIEALDVNNCLDEAYDNGGGGWDSRIWSQVRCPMNADSAKETIKESVAIMLVANLIGYFVLKKSREQITEIQDSITEMEED